MAATHTRLAKIWQWLGAVGAAPSPDKTGKIASWQVLRDRRFLGYFSGSLISNIGTWLQNTVQMLLAYRLTHSAFAVGTVMCLQFSGFLFTPWTGAVIVFCAGFAAWVSLVAAIVAGVAALLTGAATQALLIHWAGDGQRAKVLALWALAWAGSKPLASFADGALASRYGVFSAGVLLAAPALAVASSEIVLPLSVKNSIKRFAAKSRQEHTANQAT